MAKQNTPKIITKKHMARLERERRQVNLIRGIAIAGILIVAGLLAFGYLQLNVFQRNEPVAKVEGVEIKTGDWQERVRFQRVQMVNAYNQYAFYQQNFGFDYSQQMQQIAASMSQPEVIGQEVLDQMVDEILIRQAAEKLGITVTDEEIEKSVRENFGFFPDGTPTPTITPTEVVLPTLSSQQLTLYPSTATPTNTPRTTVTPTGTQEATATLAPTSTPAPATPTPVPQEATATSTPYTVEGFQKDYDETLKNFQTYDISEKTIRSVYEAQLYREKLKEQVTSETPRTEEQVWARHILVETEEEAKAIYDRIKDGEDFVEIAKVESKDTGSGANGGDLGWFGRGAMVMEFENAAFNLEVGEVSEPVQSEFGYHVIQALGHQEVPLNASQYEQKKETEFSNWLVTERSKRTIETFDVWKERVPTEPTLQTTPIQQ